MLNLLSTRVFHTELFDVLSGIAIQEEGMALSFIKDNGITKVHPSLGVANEVFAGFSLSRNVPPEFVPNVEEFIIKDSLIHDLVRSPMAGQCLVKVGGSIKSIVLTTPANAGQVMLTGNTLAFAAGENGKSCFVQYMYEPTISEAAVFTGHAVIGSLAFRSMDNIGCIVRGTISTNYFDASVDWSAALAVKLGVNGMVTTTGSGATLPNVTIMNSPNSTDPFLTLRMV